MSKLALAISITAKAFEKITDKGGTPYILHCLFVMNKTIGDECTKCAAVMHDLVEDKKITINELIAIGFSEKTINLVRMLTHDKQNVSYEDYIKSISTNKEATKIKIADLRHNTDVTRMKDLRKKDFDRLEKYFRAYKYLKN